MKETMMEGLLQDRQRQARKLPEKIRVTKYVVGLHSGSYPSTEIREGKKIEVDHDQDYVDMLIGGMIAVIRERTALEQGPPIDVFDRHIDTNDDFFGKPL